MKTNNLHFRKHFKVSNLLLVALLLVVSPYAESSSNKLAVGNAATVGNSLLKNIGGRLIDTAGKAWDAAVRGNKSEFEQHVGEIKKIPGQAIKDSYPVLKAGDFAKASWDGFKKRLNPTERRIRQFYGYVTGAATDPRAAIATDNEESDRYASTAPLPKLAVTRKASNVRSNNATEGWGTSTARSDWSDVVSTTNKRHINSQEWGEGGFSAWVMDQRDQMTKAGKCLGICDDDESDTSQSNYASALANTIGDSSATTNSQYGYATELQNLDAKEERQRRLEEERRKQARLEEAQREQDRLEEERRRQQLERERREYEEEERRLDALEYQREQEYNRALTNNIIQSLYDFVEMNSGGSRSSTNTGSKGMDYDFYGDGRGRGCFYSSCAQ